MGIPRRRAEVPDLKADTIAVLLGGWSANPPDGVPPGPPGFGQGFIDLYEDAGIVRLWRQHARFLRATAKAWGWEPQFELPDGRRGHYAEHVAATLEDSNAHA
jgi:hypothetical protein